jgi:ParB family chromosome partitioning protein
VSNLIRLLDLPDELLELLETGELSEGHGRALLAARGNDVRRRLGREAAKHGWSVRETENRAKLASQPKRANGARTLDAEEEAALRDAADRLESALGHEVLVRPRKGEEVSVEIRFEDIDEALALARRVAGRRRA